MRKLLYISMIIQFTGGEVREQDGEKSRRGFSSYHLAVSQIWVPHSKSYQWDLSFFFFKSSHPHDIVRARCVSLKRHELNKRFQLTLH